MVDCWVGFLAASVASLNRQLSLFEADKVAPAGNAFKPAQDLSEFGIDKEALKKLGIDEEAQERVCRAMLVHSQGLRAVFQEASSRASNSKEALLILGRGFQAVLEQAGLTSKDLPGFRKFSEEFPCTPPRRHKAQDEMETPEKLAPQVQQAVNGNVQVELEQKLERSRADFEACEAQLLQLQHHSSLRQEHQELQQSHNCLQMEHKQLQTGHAGVAQAREQLTSDVENLRREMLQKLQERDEHISTIVDLRADAEKRLEAKQGELDRLVADFEQERRLREDAENQLEATQQQVSNLEYELDVSLQEAEQQIRLREALLAELGDATLPLDYVGECISYRAYNDKAFRRWAESEHKRLTRRSQDDAEDSSEAKAAGEENEEPKEESNKQQDKKKKTMGRGTPSVLPREILGSSVILTAGGGSCGHKHGPNPGAIACRQGEEEIRDSKHQIDMERRLTQVCTDLSHTVPGVFGQVVTLFNPVQQRFRLAVNVVLKGHLDTVVTQTVDVARYCKRCLKDAMMAPPTFLPLDNALLKSMIMDPWLHEALQGRRLRPALSCISFEPSLSRAFDFLLSDVVIADSLDAGRKFVLGVAKELGLKCRVVTLSGEVISRDGKLAERCPFIGAKVQ